MHRLTIALGVCTVVFAATTVVQSYRLWEAQHAAATLRLAAEKARKEPQESDSFPNPPANRAVAGQKGGAASEAADDTGVGGKTFGASDESVAGSAPGRPPQGTVNSANLEKTRSSLQQSLRDNPKNASAWRQLALVERQLGNLDAELDAYKKWVEALPDDKRARFLAAEAFARRGMNEQALQYLADFRAMSSDNPRSNAAVANLYELMKLPDEQGEALRQWVSAAPDSTDAHRALGDYYRQAGQTEQALVEFQQMAELQPNDPAIHMQLGTAYMQMGKSAEALSQFQTAVDLSPYNTDALGRLALTQRQTGDMQGAIANYQRVVDIDPGSPAGVRAAQSIQSIQEGMNAPVQTQP